MVEGLAHPAHLRRGVGVGGWHPDGQRHLTAAEWRQVPDDLRMGLEHEEYLDVRDKYAVVVASPIIDDSGPRSRVVGCLALDGPEGRLDSLSSDEVLGLLNFTGQALLSQVG